MKTPQKFLDLFVKKKPSPLLCLSGIRSLELESRGRRREALAALVLKAFQGIRMCSRPQSTALCVCHPRHPREEVVADRKASGPKSNPLVLMVTWPSENPSMCWSGVVSGSEKDTHQRQPLGASVPLHRAGFHRVDPQKQRALHHLPLPQQPLPTQLSIHSLHVRELPTGGQIRGRWAGDTAVNRGTAPAPREHVGQGIHADEESLHSLQLLGRDSLCLKKRVILQQEKSMSRF